MEGEEIKLDNPVWYSLKDIHNKFSVEYNGIKFYHPDYCSFGGPEDSGLAKSGIDTYAQLVNNFYVVGDLPVFTDNVQLKKELVCNQMILYKPIDVIISEQIKELKTVNQKNDLFDLVNLVQPGYFKNKTPDLGSYYGIYNDNRLVAVAGERMKMNEYTEVSAVVTHPEYLGKGYAKQLVAFTSNKIFKGDKIPYLHVAKANVEFITQSVTDEIV